LISPSNRAGVVALERSPRASRSIALDASTRPPVAFSPARALAARAAPCRAAPQHAWVVGDDDWLRSRSLNSTLGELKRFQSKKKFKAAAKAVIATHRMKTLFLPMLAATKAIAEKPRLFAEVYNLKDELGQGALSIVKCAIHKKTGERFAVKVVQKSQLHLEDQEALLAEV
jgi:hypothetical protein